MIPKNSDLNKVLSHGSLFSGIGGFDLAAQWMGWNNIFHCEWNEFGQKVLKYYWPNAISYGDITKTDFTIHRGRINVLTGGFPCQPFSAAGKRKGKEDERHLWPEMLRAIREIQPDWVVGENVPGIINWSGGLVFNEVQTDLENEGYKVLPILLPACAVNAPHRRDRIWFVAYNTSMGRGQGASVRGEIQQEIRGAKHNIRSITPTTTRTSSDTEGSSKSGELLKRQGQGEFGRCNSKITPGTGNQGLQRCKDNGITGESGEERNKLTARPFCTDWQEFPTQSPLCGRNDGISDWLDFKAVWQGTNPRKPWLTYGKWRNESIKAYGNAIVPQVVLEIFKVIGKMSQT